MIAKKIKIAFIYDRPLSYMGGYNYLYNLLFALKTYGFERKNVLIFCPNNISQNRLLELEKCGTVIKSRFITKWNINWFVNRFFLKFFSFSPFIYFCQKKYSFTHTYFSSWNRKRLPCFKQIYWLPDLQFLTYPEYFSDLFIKKENKNIKSQIKNSYRIIVSSNTIKNEFFDNFKINTKEENVLKVLKFTSSIIHFNSAKEIKNELKNIVKNNSLENGFFFCPNQFWPHKNHLKLIKAFSEVLKIKDFGNLNLVLTGSKFFNKKNSIHFDNTIKLINDLNIQKNVIHLNELNLIQIQALYTGCLALINPSLYEGWSTTIEEARAYRINMLISNIKVNKEQDCLNAQYFNPNSVTSIKNQLIKFLSTEVELISKSPNELCKARINKDAKEDSKRRLIKYAETFLQICSGD